MKADSLVSGEIDTELPLSPSCAAVDQPPLPAILIVEDDDDLGELVRYRLEREGFATVIARDGTEACRLLAEVEVDLVLLDILMPGMDGWEVCRWLRGHKERRIATLPVIMLTALAAGESRVKGLECGADVYLAKPYSIREVVLNCRRLINERQERSRLRAELVALREKEEGAVVSQRMLFHELRSQFTVIGGLCHRMLKSNDPIQLSEMARERGYLEVIRQSLYQVSEMADEVLLLSRLGGDNLNLPATACRVDEIVAEVLVVCQAKAQLQGVGLQVSPLPSQTVNLHRLALKIILASLLENAVKYSPLGSLVSLQVALVDGSLIIEVSDQGPGIPPAEQEKVFEPFFRGQAVRDSHAGSGLGLYSVKRLTEALGGGIRLASTPGAGAHFRMVFPDGEAVGPG